MNSRIAKRLRTLSEQLIEEDDLQLKAKLYKKLKKEYTKSTKAKSWKKVEN